MIRHRVHRANFLDLRMLERLKSLTNDPSRGDVRDDGTPAGSTFLELINERLSGNHFPRDCWIILAWDMTELVGWCMLSRVETSPVRSGWHMGNLGLYIRPDRRRLGYASGLIQAASEVARKNTMRSIVANPWNSSSHACFTRAGFVDNTEDVPGRVKLDLLWH